jgi:hypothetical protein
MASVSSFLAPERPMARNPTTSLILALLCGFALACTHDPLGLDSGEGMRLHLEVSGGLAGVGYTVVLNGSSGVLKGESCSSGCDFGAGDVLQILAEEEVEYIWSLFQEAAIHFLDGRDFGVQCCDQFHYDLSYEDSQGTSAIRGSSEALPSALRVAVATVHGLVGGTLPLIVDLSTHPDSWPRDPFQIQNAEVGGDLLDGRISYGGGCRVHDVKGVAWGGWMESNPVQVRLFLSHEDFDDPCDAWVTRDFRFDLGSLKKAYQDEYGVGLPGTTTLILLLEDPLLASPLGARILEYVF